MGKIAFDKKELEVLGKAPFSGAPIFKTPVSCREAFEAAYRKEAIWLPYGIESSIFAPEIIPDNISRGFVISAESPKYNENNYGGPDMFGVEWVYVPVVGGSMEKPGMPHLLPDGEVEGWEEKITFPDLDSWDWDKSARDNEAFLQNGLSNMVWFLNGMGFERLISFMGFENAAMALLDEEQEDALKGLLQALTDLHIKLVDKCIEAYGKGISGFTVHDDWGSQMAPFFSEDVAQEFFVPMMKQLTDHIKSKGLIADLHSCGHIEDRIQCILDGGWQSWTPMPMNDTKKLYKEYGDQILLGVVDTLAEGEDPAAKAKAFVDEYYSPEKPCTFSLYSGPLGGNEAYVSALYEASRQR